MSCKCASYNSKGRYNCTASGSECIYLFPNSKRCAEEYGEGPDAERNRCEDCKEFYIEDGKRCCKTEPLTFIDGDFVNTKYIDSDVICCGGFRT